MIEDIIKTSTKQMTDARTRQKKHYNRHSNVGSQADDDIKYCKNCDRCWEYRRSLNGNKEKKIVHYNDFVTFGKQREVCPICENVRRHCDLCETDRDDITKEDGIWSCTECDVTYPKEEEDE